MKIGMGMIVRNEEADLPRCLESFLPQVDVICIIDTGCTDRTVEVAEAILSKSGKAYSIRRYLEASDSEGRMCNFGKARNEYIMDLEKWDGGSIDYFISIDADDIFISKNNIRDQISANPADIYSWKYWIAEKQYFMTYKCWKNGHGLRFDGRVHEVLGINWKLTIKTIDIDIKHHVEHHEGQEHGTQRNMRILRSEIYPPLRSLFYWANENVDINQHHEAIRWYLEYIRRCKAGEACWNVELAHCYWRCARWLQHIGDLPNSDRLCHELVANDPSWSEAWCQLAYNCRVRGEFDKMREYALKALQNTWTARLFSEEDKYGTTPANMIVFLDLQQKIRDQEVSQSLTQ